MKEYARGEFMVVLSSREIWGEDNDEYSSTVIARFGGFNRAKYSAQKLFRALKAEFEFDKDLDKVQCWEQEYTNCSGKPVFEQCIRIQNPVYHELCVDVLYAG